MFYFINIYENCFQTNIVVTICILTILLCFVWNYEMNEFMSFVWKSIESGLEYVRYKTIKTLYNADTTMNILKKSRILNLFGISEIRFFC